MYTSTSVGPRLEDTVSKTQMPSCSARIMSTVLQDNGIASLCWSPFSLLEQVTHTRDGNFDLEGSDVLPVPKASNSRSGPAVFCLPTSPFTPIQVVTAGQNKEPTSQHLK